jgi:hypothetical protein
MNWGIPFIMGVTAMCYIHTFNHMMKQYNESGNTMTFLEYVQKNVSLIH